MKTFQEELKDRGYFAVKDPEGGDNDIIIQRQIGTNTPYDMAHIKYSEVLQRNTAQEKLDFILSKLPNDTK